MSDSTIIMTRDPVTGSPIPFPSPADSIQQAYVSYVRVADTNAYTIGDEISTSVTPASALPLTFLNINVITGSGLLLVGAVLSTNQKACVAQVRLHLYNAVPTMSGDNLAFGWYDVDNPKWLGYLDFDALQTEDVTASTGAFAMAGSVKIPGTATARTLYGRLETKTAFTPANAQTFNVSLFPARYKPDAMTDKALVGGAAPDGSAGTLYFEVRAVTYDDTIVTGANYKPGDPTVEANITVVFQDVLQFDLPTLAAMTPAALLTYFQTQLDAWATTNKPLATAMQKVRRVAMSVPPRNVP